MESVPEPDADSAELDATRRHAPDPDTAVELPTDAVVAPEPLALGPLAEVAAVADDGELEAHMMQMYSSENASSSAQSKPRPSLPHGIVRAGRPTLRAAEAMAALAWAPVPKAGPPAGGRGLPPRPERTLPPEHLYYPPVPGDFRTEDPTMPYDPLQAQ